MKSITKIFSLIMLSGALVGCVIVMPTKETANKGKETPSTSDSKESTYKRPTPTTTEGTEPTRPRPPRKGDSDTYSRPTPTTTVVNSETSTSKDEKSDGRIDAPAGKKSYTKSDADTTIQVRSRVRR